MLKILQARLHSTWTEKFHIYNLDLEKLEEPEIKLPLIHWIIEKAREIQKSIYFCFSDYTKASDSVVHKNCGKFFKKWEYQATWPAYWEICIQVKKQHLELDMEQQTGSKLGKEYIKAVYCHLPCLFNLYAEYIMRNARLDEAQDAIKILGEI